MWPVIAHVARQTISTHSKLLEARQLVATGPAGLDMLANFFLHQRQELSIEETGQLLVDRFTSLEAKLMMLIPTHSLNIIP